MRCLGRQKREKNGGRFERKASEGRAWRVVGSNRRNYTQFQIVYLFIFSNRPPKKCIGLLVHVYL